MDKESLKKLEKKAAPKNYYGDNNPVFLKKIRL